MNILVIGGAGYIGSHVVLELLNANHSIFIFDNFSTGSENNIPIGVQVAQGDILDNEALDSVFKLEQFDAVIHLAAKKAAGESMERPDIYANNNLIGTINILNAMADNNVKMMVFSSSAAVYGFPEYLPIDEKHPTKPANFYGYTKLAIEELLKWYSELKGIHFAALRYFNAAGYDPQGRMVDAENGVANLLPIVMEAAIGKRDEVLVFGDDYDTKDGTGVRDYIHVTDLASAHLKALNHLTLNQEDLILNLGTGNGYSVLDVLNECEKVTGRTVKVTITGRRAGDPDELTAYSNSAEKILGWKACHSDLNSILSSMWKLYQTLEKQ